MGSSPENTLTNFDLDLLFCSASTSLTENTEHGYQTKNLELAGSKTQSYQVQNMGISGSTHHSYQIPNMGTCNQGYQVQNIGITGPTGNSYEIANIGNMGIGNQDYRGQNIGITETKDNGYQSQNMGTTDQCYQVQNVVNELSFFGHGNDVVKKSDYEALVNHLQKLSGDFASLQNDYDAKNQDYEAVKKQYAKLASDYANLNTENKEHAMASLNISAKCEILEQKEVEYLAAIKTLNMQCEKQSLDIYAQSKQFFQFQSHVEDLKAEISKLKSNVKSEKSIGRDGRKMISTLTSNNQTLEEHLCLFACIIEGRKQIDKDTRRYIKKYCKKNGVKKSMETERLENQSIDTGRGSSLAFSDGDRSFYSPSYSITLSPFSTGVTTPQNEPTKMTRDASSSPTPTIKTSDISTSPIIFEEVINTPPSIQTCDVATNTMIYDEARNTRDITTSPIEFADKRTSVVSTQTWSFTTSPTEFDDTRTPVARTKGLDIAASPIMFAETETPIANTETWSIATSPTDFDDITPVAPTKTLNIAISPVMFDDMRSPVVKIKTLNIATSPVMLEDMRTPLCKTKTSNSATSPVMFDDISCPAVIIKTSNIATSPVMFNDMSNPVVKIKTLNIATSPIMFEDMKTPLCKTKTSNTATSPVMFDDMRSPAVKIKTSNISTSPVMFNDMRSPIAKIKTLNIATSPVMFEDMRTPLCKTKTSNSATSPVMFDDIRSPAVKIKTSNIATSPVMFDDMRSPAVKIKNSNIATSPVMFDDIRSPAVKIKTSNIATSPVMFDDMRSLAVKIKTSNIATSPLMFDDIRSPAVKIKTSNIATSPVIFNRSPAAKTKTSNTATSPVMVADTITPVSKTKPLDISTNPMNGDAKIPVVTRPLKTSETARPSKCPNTRNSLHKTKKLHAIRPSTENLKPTNSLASNCNTHCIDRLESPVLVSNKTNTDLKTSTATHLNKITEKLKEIVSKQADYSKDDADNDWEIKMILSKHRLNWDLLSPISITPEGDQENEQIQSERKEEIKEHSCNTNKKENETSDILAQSLHLFGDIDSDDEIDSEDLHMSDLPIENSQHVVTSDDVFDIMKSSGENADIEQNNSTTLIKNIVSELPDEISDKNHAKPYEKRGTTKYKKLTNLQKIYKANTPKSKIKSQHPPSLKKQKTRPKSHSIPPIINSVATLSHNEEKGNKLTELNAKTLLHKKKAVEVYKESIKCSYKEPPVPSESNEKRVSTESISSSGLSLTQTIQPPASSPKKRVNISKETQYKNGCLPRQTRANAKYGQKKNSLNSNSPSINGISPGILNPLPEYGRKKRHCMPTGTQSSNISVLPVTQTNILQESNKESELNSKCEHSEVQTNRPPDPCLQPELINDIAYTYPKPTIKRVSRVGKGISTNPVVTNVQSESNNTNEIISCVTDKINPPSKRPANYIINDELDVKRKRIAQENVPKSDVNMEISQTIDESVNDNKNSSSSDQTIASLDTSEADAPMGPDAGNNKAICTTKSPSYQTRSCADYNDITMFTAPKPYASKKHSNDEIPEIWSHNLLDRMIHKYGSNPGVMDIPKCDEVVVLKFKTGIAKCVKSMSKQDEYEKAIQQLVQELLKQGKKKIIKVLMKFLNDPARKAEFIGGNKGQKGRITEPTASQTEMALIDVIDQLEKSGVDLWDLILDSSEFILFTLERGATPGFDVVESVAHFYANICRYRRNMSRMWMFMLNAMYCLSFKAVPLMMHCLDVVPEVIPYANRILEPGLAPLIRCLVFLMNFPNSDDPFKRVDEIRRRLKYKYYYSLQDENETTLLFLLKQSIINLTEKKLERDMLELSFLIVAKRRGTKWCHKNIVQKIFLPMIKGEIDVSYRARTFCITTIGYILKPYNNEMVVHAEEVVNLLINMFNQQSQTQEMKEDIIRGLINMDMKTVMARINTCLLQWNPPSVSPELEEALESFVRKKYLRNWLTVYQDHYKEI